jgi:hypothetical protein
VQRLRRSVVALVAGILLVLVSAGACDDGATGPSGTQQQPQPGGAATSTDDGDEGPDDPGDDSSGPGDDSEGPGDDGPSDESEGGDDGGVPGRGNSSDN